MAHIREDFIWLMVLVVGFGALAIINLGRALPYLIMGEVGPGVTVALILGATATLLALSALVQWLAVVISLLKQRGGRHGNR